MPAGRQHFGKPDEHLRAIAEKFGVTPGTWYGFVYNNRKILFRDGKPEKVRPKRKYSDCPIFHDPFGTEEKRRGMDFLLLQAGPTKFFYLMPTSTAASLSKELGEPSVWRYPKGTQKSFAKEIADKLEPYRKQSVDDIKLMLGGGR